MPVEEKNEVLHPRANNKQNRARREREKKQENILRICGLVIGAILVVLLIGGAIYEYGYKPNKVLVNVAGDTTNVTQFQEAVRYQRAGILNEYQQMSYLYQQFGMSMDENTINQYKLQLDPSYASLLGSQAITGLVNQKLLDYGAKELGISVSDEEVQDYMRSQFGFFPNGTATPAPTDIPFENTPTVSQAQLDILRYTETPLPTATLEPTEVVEALEEAGPEEAVVEEAVVEEPTAEPTAELEPTEVLEPTATLEPTVYTEEMYENNQKVYFESNTYFSKEFFTQQVYYQLLREKVLAELTKDLEREGDMVWARHMLVPTEEEAQKIIDRLNDGEEWGDVAAEISATESEDKVYTVEDLGWFTADKMVPEFSDVAFALEVGGVNEKPVHSDFGYHVIQVIGHEVRPLTSEDYSTKQTGVYSEWLTALEEKVPPEINDSWVDFVPTTPEFSQF